MRRAKEPLRRLQEEESVRLAAEKVFRRHGAIHVDIGHLMPKGVVGDHVDGNHVVKLMAKGGSVVNLPADLRTNFAWMVSKMQIASLRRYCIAPVSVNTNTLNI